MPGYIPIKSSDGYQLLDSDSEELLLQTDQMSVGFCVNSGEPDRLDKTSYLSEFEWIAGTLRDESSILAPTLLIEYPSFPNWNYAYIPNFNRYYFIQEITSVRVGLWRVILREDVMMSYKEDIRSHKAMIARNEFDYNEMVNDEIYPAEYKKAVEEYFGDTDNATIEFKPDANLSSKRHIAVTTVVNFRGNSTNVDSPSPDVGYLPQIRGSNFTGVSLYQTYAMTEAEFLYLSKAIIENDDLGTFLLSAINYPYELPWDNSEDEMLVVLGKTGVLDPDIPNDLHTLLSHKLSSPYLEYAILGSVEVGPAQSFEDYEPYRVTEVYVPYSGWVKLPLDVTQGGIAHKIICYYAIDHIQGTATAYLYDKTMHRAIWSAPAQIGVKLGITATNNYENRRTEEANNLNLAMSTVGSVIAVVAGIASENPVAVAGGVLSEARAIGQFANTQNRIVDRAQASMGGGMSNISTFQKLRVRNTTMVSSYGGSDFNHQYGRPLNQVRQIGTLTGYTVVGEVHLEIPSAYPPEVNEIESILKGGFHI